MKIDRTQTIANLIAAAICGLLIHYGFYSWAAAYVFSVLNDIRMTRK